MLSFANQQIDRVICVNVMFFAIDNALSFMNLYFLLCLNFQSFLKSLKSIRVILNTA